MLCPCVPIAPKLQINKQGEPKRPLCLLMQTRSNTGDNRGTLINFTHTSSKIYRVAHITPLYLGKFRLSELHQFENPDEIYLNLWKMAERMKKFHKIRTALQTRRFRRKRITNSASPNLRFVYVSAGICSNIPDNCAFPASSVGICGALAFAWFSAAHNSLTQELC